MYSAILELLLVHISVIPFSVVLKISRENHMLLMQRAVFYLKL